MTRINIDNECGADVRPPTVGDVYDLNPGLWSDVAMVVRVKVTCRLGGESGTRTPNGWRVVLGDDEMFVGPAYQSGGTHGMWPPHGAVLIRKAQS